MKFESTYNIGDVFWKIESNKPVAFTIVKVTMLVNKELEVSEGYIADYCANRINNHRALTVKDIKNDYYLTKEECILSLFKV